MVLAVFAVCLCCQAQTAPASVDWRDAHIKDVGAYLIDFEYRLDKNPVTHEVDTIWNDHSRMVWESEGADVVNIENNDFYKSGEAVPLVEIASGNEEVDSLLGVVNKGMRRISPWPQEGALQDLAFNKFYYNVFTFEYPSVDAAGNPVMLSAIAACPTKNGVSQVNNVVLGTHITITADRQRPSAQTNNFQKEDWGLLFSLAGGNKLSYKTWFILVKLVAEALLGPATSGASAGYSVYDIITQIMNTSNNNNCNNNLVIMPDYQGYGLTKNQAHPYLYQELTARQCLDAFRYGIALYRSAPELNEVRHGIRNDFRGMSIGYSQGGSVAMACHRFVEQNGLTNELHFSGSVCGDGPYDPLATLMYYVKQDNNDQYLSMAVVLPLIMKGMLDTNPYMKNHKPADFFVPKFLETGILDWLTEKELSTDEIGEELAKLYDNGKDGDQIYFRDIIPSKKKETITVVENGEEVEKEIWVGMTKLSLIMQPEFLTYFRKLYNDNKNTYTSAAGIPLPTRRGLMEDLHFALASNDMTTGWAPQHKMILFHSQDDTVVPYDNALSAVSRLGDKVRLESITEQDHVPAGTAFFSQNSTLGIVFFNGLRLCDYVNELGDWDY